MTGLFFDYTGDNRVIDKAVNEQQPLATISNITPYRALSPLTGTIELTYNATVFAANYCKLDSKYYYITDRELLPGGKMSLVLRCDVLKTYATPIKALTVWCKRSAVRETKYMIDNKAPIEARKVVSANPLSEISAHSTDMIMITVG